MRIYRKFYIALAFMFASGFLVESSGLLLALCFVFLGIAAGFTISGNLDIERAKRSKKNRNKITTIRRAA